MTCPLCGEHSAKTLACRGGRRAFECGRCRLVFAAKEDRLSREECGKRYLLHENSIENKGYCEFLSRAIDRAIPFLPRNGSGLDYGCGPGPTLSKLMRRQGYTVADYDPIFFDAPLSASYDFIFSTECFEHFEEPRAEIAKVVGLLGPGGILTVMTDLWNDETDFSKWHYASDPTHVSFYSTETLDYVAKTFGLSLLDSDRQKVSIFLKK